LAAYPYLPTWQAMTIERAQFVFHHIIRVQCAIWVGILDEHIVAYLAMNQSYIDRLYVDPSEWRKGWGTQLVNFAKHLSPSGLELGRIQLPEVHETIVAQLNTMSTATRYPEDMVTLAAEVTRKVAQTYLIQTQELLTWLRADDRLQPSSAATSPP
jgi:hypothetical protein